MSSDVFEGTGQASPVLYHAVSDRDSFVTSKYLQNGHKNDDLRSVVTIGGEPITVNDETLTVGMVPIERRWAIELPVDGKAELMDPVTFSSEYEVWYTHNYAFKGQEPDDVSKAIHPTPRNYVSWKVDPYDKAKLLPLGMPSPNEVATFDPQVDGAKNYDPVKDQFIEESAVESEKDMRIAELEAKLDALSSRLDPVEGFDTQAAADEQMNAESPPAMTQTPCGREVQANRINQHKSRCSVCKEIETG